MTTVVHCKRAPFDVYIGRPARGLPGSKWANPFRIGRDGDRAEVIAKYEAWVRTRPDLMAALSELEGKILGCWCAPEACHGDVLVRLADIHAQAHAALADMEAKWEAEDEALIAQGYCPDCRGWAGPDLDLNRDIIGFASCDACVDRLGLNSCLSPEEKAEWYATSRIEKRPDA